MQKENIFTDTIDSRDTDFTIDTYSIFTRDSEFESEVDFLQSSDSDELRADYGLPEFDDVTYFVDDYLDFDYDNAAYHEALASASIDIVEELDSESAEIFTSLTYSESGSPRFYNFTTDWYTVEISYDRAKLQIWIQENEAFFAQYLQENPNLNFHDEWRYWGGVTPTSYSGNENWVEALYGVQLLAYLHFLYEENEGGNWGYLCEMFDRTSEAAYNSISWEIRPDKKEECAARIVETQKAAIAATDKKNELQLDLGVK